MAKNLLKINEIISKEFTKERKGYNPTEVDQYIDEIVKSYSYVLSELDLLKNSKTEITNKIDVNDIQELEKVDINSSKFNTDINNNLFTRISLIEEKLDVLIKLIKNNR